MGAWFASIDLSLVCPSLVKFGIYPYSMAAFVGLVLLLIETLYLYFALPETIHNRSLVEASSTSSSSTSKLTLEMIHRRLLDLVYLKRLMCGFSFLFSGMEFTLVFLTFDILDFSHMQQGKLLGYMGIISALIQGGYVRRKVNTVGEKILAIQGMVSCAVGLYCLANSVTSVLYAPHWLYAGVTCLAFTSGTVVNCLTSLASLQCHEDSNRQDPLSKGRALGEFRSYGQLGRALGPITASAVYWLFGPRPCYSFSALLMIGMTWMTVLSAPSRKKLIKKTVKKTQ